MSFFPWLDSANGGDGSSRWTAFNPEAVDATASSTGRAAYRINTISSAEVRLTFTEQTSVTVGFKWQAGNDGTDDGTSAAQIFSLRHGSTIHLTMTFSTNGVIHIRRGAGNGTLLATSDTGVWAPNVWHDFEVAATIDDSNGLVQVWVDGVKVIDFTGDTRNGGTAAIDTVRWGRTSSGGPGPYRFSDIVIDSGISLKGPTRVLDSYPSADGANTDLTSSGEGDNYEMVNEATPDGDSSYVSGDTEGQKDTYALDNPVPEGYEVLAVQVSHYSRKADSGTRFARPVIRSGGTDYGGASEDMAESYTTYRDTWTTDPDTSEAWTRSGRNAIEAGVEVRDS